MATMVMLPVYELLVGLAAATAQESDAEIRCKIQTAQVMTVFSWGTYPVVYLFRNVWNQFSIGYRVHSGRLLRL